MNKELQTRIETYIWQHAETLNIPVTELEWSEDCAAVPDSGTHSSTPSYKLRVAIEGKPHSLTITEEECHALEIPEDHGAEAWPRMTEKIDEFLGAFAPKKPRIGY